MYVHALGFGPDSLEGGQNRPVQTTGMLRSTQDKQVEGKNDPKMTQSARTPNQTSSLSFQYPFIRCF